MSNTHLIAAFIASNAIVTPRPACPFCGKPPHAKACPDLRARLLRKTNPRYFFCAGDIYDEHTPLRDDDITARLNEQDDDYERLMTENAALREQLANAFDAIGCARALLAQQSYDAAALVLDDAMKGGER